MHEHYKIFYGLWEEPYYLYGEIIEELEDSLGEGFYLIREHETGKMKHLPVCSILMLEEIEPRKKIKQAKESKIVSIDSARKLLK